MPKLSLEAQVTTKAEVALKPKLLAQVKALIEELYMLTAQSKEIAAKIKSHKEGIELSFDVGKQYSALEEGVRVVTPFGEIPVKLVTGKTGAKLNEKKLMTKFKLTPKDLDSCRDKPKDKAPYLGVWFPKTKDEDEEDDE